MVDQPPQDANADFLAEAQELVEGMSRDLLLLDQSLRSGEPSPDLLNGLFRGVHTLKGLAGMFGFAAVGRLAHVLEDLLDHLRLGQASLDASTLDVLFQGAEAFAGLLASGDDAAGAQSIDVEDFGARVRGVIRARSFDRDVLEDYDFDPATLSVLTEYEEHRLRSHLQRGHRVVRAALVLPLDTIEHALEQLKLRIASVGEVISYLPSLPSDDPNTIALDLMVATSVSDDSISTAVALPCTLAAVRRKHPSMRPPMHTLPPPSHGSASHAPPSVRPTGPLTDAPTGEHPHNRSVLPPTDQRSKGAQLSLKSLTNVVRVDVRKLDHLMNAVADLGTLRNAMTRLIERLPLDAESRKLRLEAQRTQRSFERKLGDVQAAVLDVRMVPLAQVFDKLAVAVRQVAREQDKRVQLVLLGAATEVDKLIAEEIADPLMHLVRNAIDHGIEDAAGRARAGKPELSKLVIEAQQRGSQVVVEVRDDGRGLDAAVIAAAALERGLLTDAEVSAMSEQALLEAIFLPGLSTRPNVSDVSGRGVGLDVVKTNVQRLGGTVLVSSELGKGSNFSITLPITLAIIRALMFVVRGRTLSLPLAAVSEVTQLDPAALRTIEGREVLDLRGVTLPLVRLGELLGFASQGETRESYVIVLMVGNRRVGVVVQQLLGQQDVVIKPLGPSLRMVRGVAGATDLGSAQLVLVLDAGALVDDALSAKGSALLRAGGVA